MTHSNIKFFSTHSENNLQRQTGNKIKKAIYRNQLTSTSLARRNRISVKLKNRTGDTPENNKLKCNTYPLSDLTGF
jgi:hypothetical protein